MSAEEIENALINPNDSLAKLHIVLLERIRPFSKKLSDPDAWVTNLCKKLDKWWPWVAEGEVPLTAAKGEEISRYKELDPTVRLLMLKALCEIRTEQEDLVSYINDELKQGTKLSCFRKDKIGQNKNGVSYWYDGNSVIGHRLYREVNYGMLKQNHRGKGSLDLQETKSEWEILATNLDEFRSVSEKFSTCQVGVEAAVHEAIETEVIPVLEKIQKKKERDLKRQRREESYLSGCHSYAAGVTRSCRSCRLVKYTFDDFDRAIDEAIKQTRKRKGREVERNDNKHRKHGKRGGGASDGDSQSNAHKVPPASTSDDKQNDQQGGGDNNHEEYDRASKGSDDNEEDEQQDEGSESDEEDDLWSEGSDKDKDTNSTDKVGKSDNEIISDSEKDSCAFELENVKSDGTNNVRLLSKGQNDSLATRVQTKKSSDCSSGRKFCEARNPEAKNRYRQRPTLNSAFDSSVVLDSEDGGSSENLSGDTSSEGDPSEVADSEDELSS